jgi:hypothetical protein
MLLNGNNGREAAVTGWPKAEWRLPGDKKRKQTFDSTDLSAAPHFARDG